MTSWRQGSDHQSWLREQAENLFQFYQAKSITPKGGFFELDDDGEPLGLVRQLHATSRMVHFAHWITPATMPKRFDTHFFLAEAPVGQHAVHDGGETVESVWINPLQAIREAEAGTRTLVPATTLNLEKLGKAGSVKEAFAHARSSQIVSITPTVAKAEGGVRISIPANSGYDTTEVYVARPSPA